jgi:hypothetical protein
VRVTPDKPIRLGDRHVPHPAIVDEPRYAVRLTEWDLARLMTAIAAGLPIEGDLVRDLHTAIRKSGAFGREAAER